MSHTNFLGIPVEGDIVYGEGRKDQRPIEDFRPILQAVLDNPAIEAVRWEQYTPYFNDGDVCTFRTYGISVKPTGGDMDAGEEEDGFIDHWSLDYYATRIADESKRRPEYLSIHEATKSLNDAVECGEFFDVLLDAFGDHAKVTVKSDGISVDFYEHD